MQKLPLLPLAALALLDLAGCATSFTGSAFVEGRVGCENKCRTEGLTMSGLVYLGEYSSACVCSLPPPATAAGSSPQSSVSPNAEGAVAGAAAGVVMQKEQQEIQRNNESIPF